MNKWISLVYIIACLACTGCLNQPADDPIQADGGGSEVTNGRIYGTIFNPDSSPAAFATVTFVPVAYSPFTASGNAVQGPDSVVANARGQYRLDTLSRGFYNILSRGGGGMAYLDSVFIADDYDSRVDDTLEAPNAIQGVAGLEAATDHSNIVILVLGTQTYSMTNNARGEYVIPPLAPGKYRLRFLTTVPGYGYRDTLVNVSPGDAAAVIDTVVLPLVSPQQVKNVRLRYDKHLMAMQLSWPAINPSIVKGYNVYRAVDLGGNVKQNDFPLTDTLFYQNLMPFEGQTVYYGVTSVDFKGRESEHSPVVSILVEKAYGKDSIVPSRNIKVMNSEYDMDGQGNLYVCDLDEILCKFDESGRLLQEQALDGTGGPLLPKLKQAVQVRHSARGFILIADLPEQFADSIMYTLHKFDEDLNYLGKLTLKFSGKKWPYFGFSEDSCIYIKHGIAQYETRIMRMDFNGTIYTERIVPYSVRMQVLRDTLYLTCRAERYGEYSWLVLDRDLKDIAFHKPVTWLKAYAGPDSGRVSAYHYYKCPNGQILVVGNLELDPPMFIKAYYDTLDALPFVSLFNNEESLFSQFLIPGHGIFLKVSPAGELIFRPQSIPQIPHGNQIPPPIHEPKRLYVYRDTNPGPGIIWETARKESGSLPPAIDGKIGKLNVKYEPKTMYVNLSWSLFEPREGRGFLLYRQIDGGVRKLVKKAVLTDTFYREQLIQFANEVLHYSVYWVDSEKNEVLLDKPLSIEVNSALSVDSIRLDWVASNPNFHMAVYPDGSLLFLKDSEIIKCGPGGGNCQTKPLDSFGFNFNIVKPLNIMVDGKGRVITAIMGSDSSQYPPYHEAKVLLHRFDGELALQDSLVLNVGREESSTSFFCNAAGEIFHRATLWYKTRITIFDTSFAMKKTVELPGIINQLQAVHDSVFVYSTRGGDCDKCLMEYYDSDFNKLGENDSGFYFENFPYLRKNFSNIHRMSDGRFAILERARTMKAQMFYTVGINGSLEAQVPLPQGDYHTKLISNAHSVYMWLFPSTLYIVHTGVLGPAKNVQTVK